MDLWAGMLENHWTIKVLLELQLWFTGLFANNAIYLHLSIPKIISLMKSSEDPLGLDRLQTDKHLGHNTPDITGVDKKKNQV